MNIQCSSNNNNNSNMLLTPAFLFTISKFAVDKVNLLPFRLIKSAYNINHDEAITWSTV